MSLAATLACCNNLPMVKKPWNWPGVLVGDRHAGFLEAVGVLTLRRARDRLWR